MVLERVPGVSPQKCCFQVLLAGTSCFFPAISSGEQMPAARDWLLHGHPAAVCQQDPEQGFALLRSDSRAARRGALSSSPVWVG